MLLKYWLQHSQSGRCMLLLLPTFLTSVTSFSCFVSHLAATSDIITTGFWTVARSTTGNTEVTPWACWSTKMDFNHKRNVKSMYEFLTDGETNGRASPFDLDCFYTPVTQDGDLAAICKIGQIRWVVVRSHRHDRATYVAELQITARSPNRRAANTQKVLYLVCNDHLIANFLSFHMSLVVVMNCGAGNALHGFEISMFYFFLNFILYTYPKICCYCGH